MAQLRTTIIRKAEGTRALLSEVERNLNGIGSSITFGKETIPDIDSADIFQKIASANTDVRRAKDKLEAVMQELSGRKKAVPAPDIDSADIFQKIASANTDVRRAKEKLEAVMQELSGRKKAVPA